MSDLLPTDVIDTEAVSELVTDYEWFHTVLGIVGNVSFFVGSVLFLSEGLQTAGVWLFILGSFGMMIGSIGSIIVRRARRDRDEQRWRRFERRFRERRRPHTTS